MGKSGKLIRMFMLLIACMLIVSACSGDGGGNSDGAASEEIKIRINDDPDFLDPHLATASISFQMILNMFEGLVRPTTEGLIEPAIAERI